MKRFVLIIILLFAARGEAEDTLGPLKADMDHDGKRDSAVVKYEKGSPCVSINKSKCHLLELLGPDNKLIKLKTVDISENQTILLVEYHSGSAGTQSTTKQSLLYLLRWDGKDIIEIGRFTLLDDYYDPAEKIKEVTKSTYKFRDTNNDKHLDLEVTTEIENAKGKKSGKELRLWNPESKKFD